MLTGHIGNRVKSLGSTSMHGPNRIMSLGKRFEALPISSVPYPAMNRRQLRFFGDIKEPLPKKKLNTYINPSREQETMREASRLKWTAVT